jgi:hypothetical protein
MHYAPDVAEQNIVAASQRLYVFKEISHDWSLADAFHFASFVIARSKAMEQSSAASPFGLLRFARNDDLPGYIRRAG